MRDHDVVVAGAGPTGLMLAAELALAGIDVALVERRETHDLVGSRAGGMTARTIEVLDQRGIADRFLAQGMTTQVGHYAGIPLSVDGLPTRHNYALALLQHHVERILVDWVGELGVPIYRGRDAVGFVQTDHDVHITLSDGSTSRAAYLAGCDGGRSTVRAVAGIRFPGWDPSSSYLVADAEMAEMPEWGMHRDPGPFHSFFDFGEGTVRIMLTENEYRRGEPDMDDLVRALVATRGTHYGVHSPRWISRFTDTSRQAERYRDRRVLLAGDAAHVHSPVGGQGLNTGIQDAVDLGWKLARVVNGLSPETLLDSYHDERYPVAARVLRNTMAQTALLGSGPRVDALRDTVADLLTEDVSADRFAAMMCALDIHYDLGPGHPMLGRRVPDLDLDVSGETTRLFTLLHPGRPVLVNLGPSRSTVVTKPDSQIRVIDAAYTGRWTLPVLGDVPAPSSLLIRPDGYVAWAGEGGDAGLVEAITRWFSASGQKP